MKPVAYHCDHTNLNTTKHPHFSVEMPEGESWQIVKDETVYTALAFADRPYLPEHLRDFQCPSATPLHLPISRLAEAASRALDTLDDLIAESRDPGVEALGARYELAQAIGRLSDSEHPLDEPGFLTRPTDRNPLPAPAPTV